MYYENTSELSIERNFKHINFSAYLQFCYCHASEVSMNKWPLFVFSPQKLRPNPSSIWSEQRVHSGSECH